MCEAEELRCRFLQQSAQTLCLSTPATSRQLMCESQMLGSATSTPISPSICAACGSTLLPQWTTDRHLKTKAVKIGKKAKDERTLRSKTISQQCSFCQRVTKTTVRISQSHRESKGDHPKTASLATSKAVTSSDTTLDRTNRSSSKKRAKARNDHEGLQVLLNKSAHAKLTPSLSLVDLMKR